ncbi:hypothetical protein MMC07_004119 [Pseudocyphellaria aurata]|nr:hypothetical protein [Pseudocyphellaria aurata]
MPPRLLHPDEYELVERNSSESNDTFNLDDADFESQGLTSTSYLHNQPLRFPKSLLQIFPLRLRAAFDRLRFLQKYRKSSHGRCGGFVRPSRRRICFILGGISSIICVLLVLAAVFRPSYTRPPEHYQTLKSGILQSSKDGRGNPYKQKVFIATTIYDKGGHLANGAWGKALLNLISILGRENVFLSIYENDSGPEANEALEDFKRQVPCPHSLVFEEHLSHDDMDHVTLPDGSKRVKRIAYLAEVRNRALRPLEQPSAFKFDRLLFLNDVVFDPIDAVQLLLSTHANDLGKPEYLAACAVDFINPFKFYDTFATRDLEGYSMGVPFFPWFSSAGNGVSRQDVLDGTDAVRVRSCWGGMVAFDAKFFQARGPDEDTAISTKSASTRTVDANIASRSGHLLRFRAEPDMYWDASECCLIHADLQTLSPSYDKRHDFGIFMNPYVRVAYSSQTLWWLHFTRRFERLYTAPHYMVNLVVGLPWFNPRREEQVGAKVTEKVWVPDLDSTTGGSFQDVSRIATGGGYCGMRTLQVIKEKPREGERYWETIALPSD